MCLNESVRYALVSCTPPKEIVYLSVEVIFEDALKFLGINAMNAPIEMCNNVQFVRSRSGKMSRRRLRKVMSKMERMRAKMTKRLTSQILLLKRTHWNNWKRARENRLRKI